MVARTLHLHKVNIDNLLKIQVPSRKEDSIVNC